MNSADTLIDFPKNVVVQGLYYRALLDDNDGEDSRTSQAVLAIYRKSISEAINRFTSDTDDDIQFEPFTGA